MFRVLGHRDPPHSVREVCGAQFTYRPLIDCTLHSKSSITCVLFSIPDGHAWRVQGKSKNYVVKFVVIWCSRWAAGFRLKRPWVLFLPVTKLFSSPPCPDLLWYPPFFRVISLGHEADLGTHSLAGTQNACLLPRPLYPFTAWCVATGTTSSEIFCRIVRCSS
jgi:hypothetical protein